jgi:flavin reductase (DIM6/NTAB) family NADH-FMN oxidoreductase RutF
MVHGYDHQVERAGNVRSRQSRQQAVFHSYSGSRGHPRQDRPAEFFDRDVGPSKISVPLIGEAIGNVEYKVARQIPFDDEMDLFVGEVLATHIRKDAMECELYRADANPLLYMGTKYVEGKPQGKYYAHLSSIGPADYKSPLLKKYLSQPKRSGKEG